MKKNEKISSVAASLFYLILGLAMFFTVCDTVTEKLETESKNRILENDKRKVELFLKENGLEKAFADFQVKKKN